jgi:hypothetical protein
MGWSLAWWHNYKWATYRILLVFGPDFVAPLFHRLFPDRNFDVRKMSVPSATALLSYMRLSYPAVKVQLADAIKLGNAVNPVQMVLLKNLHDMFEYFIPIVSYFCSIQFSVGLYLFYLLCCHRFLKCVILSCFNNLFVVLFESIFWVRICADNFYSLFC